MVVRDGGSVVYIVRDGGRECSSEGGRREGGSGSEGGREGGRDGGSVVVRDGGSEGGREGLIVRDGVREGEGGRECGIERWMDGGRECGRDGWREGGKAGRDGGFVVIPTPPKQICL